MLVIRELKGYKYDVRIEQEYLVPLLKHTFDGDYLSLQNGMLVIKVGYAYDGPSFLTIDTPNSMDGSLVHDALYQLMREGVISRTMFRKYADQLLRDICIKNGMWKIRAWTWYCFVRLLAKHKTFPSKNPRGKIVTIHNGKKL